MLRRPARREHGPRPGPDGAPTRGPATPSGSPPSASAEPGRGGARERRGRARRSASTSCSTALHRLGRRSAEHQLRRRQHLGQGNRDRSRSPGAPVDLLWVKGSGGDLGTLTEAGLAVLRLDRLRALVDVYPGVEREDEMVAAFDYCLLRPGRRGAVDRHGDARAGRAGHVDHLHPDSGIAFATAADGEALTTACFGDRVAWVPWRRPGFQLGLDIAAIQRGATRRPSASILGGHGITAWGETSDECEANSLEIIRTRRAVHRRARPAGAVRRACAGVRAAARGRAARPRGRALPRVCAALPRPTGRRSATSPTRDVVLDFLVARGASATGGARHVVPGPLPAHQGPSAGARPARRRRRSTTVRRGSRSCTPRTARTTAPTTSGTPRPTARRCAAPTRRSCWSPASACSASARTSRPRASPASSTSTPSTSCAAPRRISTYAPIAESEKFRIEYWALEEAKLARLPKPKPLADAGRAGHRRRLRASAARSPTGSPPRAPASSSPTSMPRNAETVAREIGGPDVARQRRRRRHRRGRRSPRPIRDAVLAFGGVDLVVNNAGLSISKPLLETTLADWDLQHDVMATRLVPRLARGGAGHDRAGDGRRHRLHRQQERVLRRPEQRRLRRVEGRPGAPGPAARRRARRSTASASTASTPTAWCAAPGSSPRAGAPTGRGPTASPRTSSASSTRSGRCSSARCCPSTWPRRSFALTGGDLSPDDRAAHPRRRRRRRRVPAVTAGGSLAARRPRRVQRPGDRRPRSGRRRLELDEVHRFPNGPVARCRRPALGRRCGLYARDPRRPAAAAARRPDLASVGDRHVGDRLRAARRGRGAARRPRPLPRRATDGGRRRGPRANRAGERSTRGPACSSCRSTPSTSWPPRAAGRRSRRARPMLLIPDLLGYWLTGRSAAEATNASTTGAVRRATRDWATDLIERARICRVAVPAAARSRATPLGPLR